MIGSLRGKLTSKQAPQIIVECQGVGYEVETPMSTFLDLPRIGEDLFLHTHLLVREDAQILYGFSSETERMLFRSVLRISGVGAKMGLAILSAMSVNDFHRCVQYEDAAMLVKIPGVGKNTANPRSEAVDALVALGYKANEVNKLIGAMDVDGKSAEDIIRLALRQAAQ